MPAKKKPAAKRTRTRRGKPCPVCRSASDTDKTRVKPNGDVMRHRVCLVCHHRWPTVEIDLLTATGGQSLRVVRDLRQLLRTIEATLASPSAAVQPCPQETPPCPTPPPS